jgi:hypothetical protein
MQFKYFVVVDKINHLGLSPTRSALARRSRQKALPPTLFIQTRFYHLHPFLRAAPQITLAPSHPPSPSHPIYGKSRESYAHRNATTCRAVALHFRYHSLRSPLDQIPRLSLLPFSPRSLQTQPNPVAPFYSLRCDLHSSIPFVCFFDSLLALHQLARIGGGLWGFANCATCTFESTLERPSLPSRKPNIHSIGAIDLPSPPSLYDLLRLAI